MFKKVLLQTDLTPSQAEILDYLYQNKEAKASEIAKKINRSRAIVYKEAEELARLGVIEKVEQPNQVTYFRASHPTHLTKLMDLRENQIKKDRQLLDNYLPDIISNFNLIHDKPGVKFYEGLKGAEKAIEDTLTSRTEILAFLDMANVNTYFKDIDEKQYQKRIKKGINKKILLASSDQSLEAARQNFPFTEVKTLKGITGFSSTIQIYDNKVAFITFTKDSAIGVILENKAIYESIKSLFDLYWSLAA